jgi:ankyrin repeat protein
MSQNSLRRTTPTPTADNSATAENSASDFLDNLNLSLLINELLINNGSDQISKEEEERLESYQEFVNDSDTDGDVQGDIYDAYQHHLDWKKIDPEGNFDNPIGIEDFRELILHTFQIFKSAFEFFFDDDDEEIKSVLSNFDKNNPFYQSLSSTEDKKILLQMMQGLTPYLTKLLSLAIDGTEQKKQTVKKFLLIFPSLPKSSDFACVAGNKQRIELASSMLFSRNIFDVALRNTLNEEIQKIFKDVDDIKQVHLFSCLLDSLTHSPELIASIDCYFKSPQDNIEIREIFSFIFESQLKLKQHLTKTLSELGDLYYVNVYKKIFDENGAINESLNFGQTCTEIIYPFMENLTPESSGIFNFDYINLFNDRDEESESSGLSELKTKEQFIEQLKKHLLKTHENLFTQDYSNFSEHPIDPQKIFSGDEENGYYLNPFSFVNLSKLFDPITEDHSPEEKITKKNKIYTGLMSLRLLTQNFINSNERFFLHYFIETFNDSREQSFQNFFYNSDSTLKEEYEEFKDLIELILNGFTEITTEYEDNKDILSLYSKLILNPSGDDFKAVINEYRQLRLNNFNNGLQPPNLLEFLIICNHHDLVKKLIELSDDDFLLPLIDDTSALKLAINKKGSGMLNMLLDINMNSDKKVIINSYFDRQDILLLAFQKGNDKLFLVLDKIEEYLKSNPQDEASIKNLLNKKYHPHSNTVLLLAVASRNFEAAKKLLAIGADINIKNSFSTTPLIDAISTGDIEMVRTLVDSQQSLELEDDYSPLSIALTKNPAIREILVKDLSELFDPITEDNSLEEKIIKKSKIHIGLLSLIPLTQNFINSNERFFLHYFIETFNDSREQSFQDFFYNNDSTLKEEYEEFKDLIESILNGFEEIKTEYKDNDDILSFYSKLTLNPSRDNFITVIDQYRQLNLNNVKDGSLPPNLLEFLIKGNHHYLVQKLIDLSDDDFLLPLIGNASALELAINKKGSGMLNMLLDIDMTSNKKVIINSYFDEQDILLLAFQKGNDKLFLVIEKIKKYLQSNPQDEASIKNLLNKKYPYDNNTVLLLAVASRNLEAAKELLAIGADINSKNSYGNTPLTYAIRTDDIEMVRTLVDSQQSLEEVDGFGNSPLSYALTQNPPVITEILLDGGAQINIDDIKSNNLILNLLTINQTELIKKFINRGLDINKSFQPDQEDKFIEEILKIDPKDMEFFLGCGLDLKTQNTGDVMPYSLCEYLLDMVEGDQNNRKVMLENLKIIFLKHPDEVINAVLLEKIQEGRFNENLKYVLELAKFAIENNPNDQSKEDPGIISIAQKIKNKIDNLLDWESPILIIGNFISHLTQSSLPRNHDAQNEMRVPGNLEKYKHTPTAQLIEKFNDLVLTMKFIVEKNKELDCKDSGNFLDNFIKLLEYKEYKESKILSSSSEDAVRFFKFIDKLIPLEKEWIINQINSLKNGNQTPIMKFVESQTPIDLKCFNYYIWHYGSINNMLSYPLTKDLNISEYIKALNLIDKKKLEALLKYSEDQGIDEKEKHVVKLCEDITKELRIKKNLLRFNADFPQPKIRRSPITNPLQATRLGNPSRSLISQ